MSMYIQGAYLHQILGSLGQLALLQPAIVHQVQAGTDSLSQEDGYSMTSLPYAWNR